VWSVVGWFGRPAVVVGVWSAVGARGLLSGLVFFEADEFRAAVRRALRVPATKMSDADVAFVFGEVCGHVRISRPREWIEWISLDLESIQSHDGLLGRVWSRHLGH
jgi:hypothetical protein